MSEHEHDPALAFLPHLASYHAEYARYGGASQELHMRAQTSAEVARQTITDLRRELALANEDAERLAGACDLDSHGLRMMALHLHAERLQRGRGARPT